MSKMVNALITAGVITPTTLRELLRWRLPVEPEMQPELYVPDSAEGVVGQVRELLESRDQVEVRVTDCYAIEQFRKGAKNGALHLYYDDKRKPIVTAVEYIEDIFGHYLVLSSSTDLVDVLCNGQTYLVPNTGKHVYFKNAQTLYVDDQPVFYRLEPSEVDT